MNREDIRKELKKVLATGKVYFGIKQARKAVKNGEAKLLIVADNCPEKKEVEEWNIPKIMFDGDGFELGAFCGKPFNVSVLTIVDEGEGKLLKMVK
ncbi:ribosomal protein L30E [Aciduliprofundum sp. MAR08-339]|uniref:50S ribosomal protein L30e n=1 Tax=Aciduliprofundum sp. (strain MAR08-339) TaxID=673860 RepID=UPI0002A4B6D3|nr:ribosomal protein L30E [Aciduliprofundum sp. MAR08-339]